MSEIFESREIAKYHTLSIRGAMCSAHAACSCAVGKKENVSDNSGNHTEFLSLENGAAASAQIASRHDTIKTLFCRIERKQEKAREVMRLAFDEEG